MTRIMVAACEEATRIVQNKKNSKIKEKCETISFFQMKIHYNDFGAAIINLKD